MLLRYNQIIQEFYEVLVDLRQSFFVFSLVAPDKPREGMIRLADGTNWNPGSGIGLYQYLGGVWVKL